MENKWWQTILLSLSSPPCFCSSVLVSLWEAKCAQTEVGQPDSQCKSADQRGESRTGPLMLRPRLHGGSSWWASRSLCKSFFTWLWLEGCAYRVRQRALPVWNQTSQQQGLIEISPRNRERLCSSQAKKKKTVQGILVNMQGWCERQVLPNASFPHE